MKPVHESSLSLSLFSLSCQQPPSNPEGTRFRMNVTEARERGNLDSADLLEYWIKPSLKSTFPIKCKPGPTLPCRLLRLEEIQGTHRLCGMKDGKLVE